jgi:uncharacterized membrane protein YkvA (DUF1232 family)
VAAMAKDMKVFKEWVRTLREDVQTLRRCIENDEASKDGRQYAAAALNYVVMRMDLVPDWEEAIGVLDDAMVLRVMVRLGMQKDLDEGLDADTVAQLGRLSNEAELIETFLGDELYAKFRKYCTRLTDESVRGRTPYAIVSDADLRKQLYEEVEDDIKRMPPASFADPEQVSVKFKSYLHHKLDELD